LSEAWFLTFLRQILGFLGGASHIRGVSLHICAHIFLGYPNIAEETDRLSPAFCCDAPSSREFCKCTTVMQQMMSPSWDGYCAVVLWIWILLLTMIRLKIIDSSHTAPRW
jgi:hypothetical protein